ncbi:F-box domain containing protein [Tanacetum coccineum]
MKADGTINKYKARLVVKEFKQREGLDFFQTYLPVTRITSIRMVLAITALRNLEVHQMDIKMTFLNRDLEYVLYTNQPEGFVDPGLESKVCRLVKLCSQQCLLCVSHGGGAWLAVMIVPHSHVVPTGCGGCALYKGNRRVPLCTTPLGRKALEGPEERVRFICPSVIVGHDPVFDLRLGGGPQNPVPLDRDYEASTFHCSKYEGINQHLQKAYNTNKASFKAKHWNADPTTGTYDVEAIRRARPEEITAAEWDKYIQFWNDPKNLARAAQNRLNRQKSVVISRQGSRSLARLRDEMRQASDTQEYPSLIDTFWRTHTVDGVFPKDEDRRIYEEMKRLEATGEYTEDEINALARGGKLRGHIPGVGRVLPSRATSRPSMSAPDKSLKSMHRKVDFMMSLFRSDSKYSDMFKEFESGGASGSGGCGDDEESGDDEDDDGERKSDSKILKNLSPATCRWGKVCHRGTNCLTEKRVGPTSSLGIIVGDCIPDEDSPATIPQRHFDGDRFPKRHVAGESPEMLLGKTPIVVVC